MHMDNKTMGWVIIAAAALLIIAWYVASNPQPTTTAPATALTVPTATTAPAATQQQPAKTTSTRTQTAPAKETTQSAPAAKIAKLAGVGSLNYLMGLKQDIACAVSTNGTTPYRSGMVYFSNGQMRADLTTTVSGQTFKSSMIDDGTYLYVWMASGTYGAKLLAASSVSGSVAASRGGIDPATNLTFGCNPWTVDTSVFAPPTDITFQS